MSNCRPITLRVTKVRTQVCLGRESPYHRDPLYLYLCAKASLSGRFALRELAHMRGKASCAQRREHQHIDPSVPIWAGEARLHLKAGPEGTRLPTIYSALRAPLCLHTSVQAPLYRARPALRD